MNFFHYFSGLNQLLWYYADLEKKKCPTASAYTQTSNVTNTDQNACIVWRRFAKYVLQEIYF